MTKEITKSYILQELQDKFGLREFLRENFVFLETVMPTYDIARHVEFPTTDFEELSITSGPVGYVFFTVPENERWYLNAYNVVFMGAGAYTVTGLYIVRKKQLTAGATIYIDMTLGQTVSYAHVLPKPIRLDPGDTIRVYVDSYTSTQNLRLYIDYLMEEIR